MDHTFCQSCTPYPLLLQRSIRDREGLAAVATALPDLTGDGSGPAARSQASSTVSAPSSETRP
jgi:hypothetical protein